MDLDFGDLPEGSSSLADFVIQNSKKMDAIDAQMTMAQLYRTEYGIFNYLEWAQKEKTFADPEQKRPMIGYAMFEAEDVVSHSRYREAIRVFADHKINELFGLNVNEYLALPRAKTLALIEVAQAIFTERKNNIGKT